MNPASFRVPMIDLSRRVPVEVVLATRAVREAEALRLATFVKSAAVKGARR